MQMNSQSSGAKQPGPGITIKLNIKNCQEVVGPYWRVSCQDRSGLRGRRGQVVGLFVPTGNRDLSHLWWWGNSGEHILGDQSAFATVP